MASVNGRKQRNTKYAYREINCLEGIVHHTKILAGLISEMRLKPVRNLAIVKDKFFS
jgi:hypothetical protein